VLPSPHGAYKCVKKDSWNEGIFDYICILYFDGKFSTKVKFTDDNLLIL